MATGVRAVASRKLEISQFLQSWKPMKEKLEELVECENSAIDTLIGNGVHPADLNDLNTHILQKKAIGRFFLIVDELKEELHGDEPSSDSDE